MHRQALLAGEHLQRILGAAGLVGCAEHAHHVLLALEQLLQHGLAEGLLSMHDDTHLITPVVPSPILQWGEG